MKKVLLSTLILMSIGMSYSMDFTLRGPNHADFLLLVKEGHSHLRKSLYHAPTKMYRGPETLTKYNIDYNAFSH